jgi:hypothetical protein
MIEICEGAAAILSALAAIGAGLVLAGRGRGWPWAAVGARLGGVATLAVALVLAAGLHGEPSPLDLRQVVLALALAAAACHLALAWLSGIPAGSPAADGAVIALVLVDLWIVRSGGPRLDCLQRTAPYWAQWSLLALGSGSSLVAGGAALTRAVSPRRWATRAGQDRLLVHGTVLTLLALGAGLAVGLWWAWRSMGTLSGGDPRPSWMAATWFLAAASGVAWQLEKHAARWAAFLALLAVATVLVGLLVLPDLQQLIVI